MSWGPQHLGTKGIVLCQSTNNSPPRARQIFTVRKQPQPFRVGAFCFLAAVKPLRPVAWWRVVAE